MRLTIVTTAFVLAFCAQAMAADIFYDRFDCYCSGKSSQPPNACSPDFCTTSSSPSIGSLHNVWVYSSWNYNTNDNCGANMAIEDNQEILYTAPYGGRCPNGGDDGEKLGQNTVNLVPYIQAALPGYSVANGSDDYPLILKFYFSGGVGDGNAIHYSNGYMELALNSAPAPKENQAPTDYVMVGNDDGAGCEDCYHTCPPPNYSKHVAWPTICQSYDPRTVSPDPCPPLQTNVRPVIAIGALAMLDNNPCHCESSDQVPQNYHLSYYDGLKWRILKSGVFSPIPGYLDWQGQPGGNGTPANDFTLGSKLNIAELRIKTSTMDIGHSTYINDVWTVSSAQNVPRLYTEGFDRLRGGTGVGCELKNDVYQCKAWNLSGYKCTRMGDWRCDQPTWWDSNKSKYVSFDRVRLSGGIGSTVTGACCDEKGNCAETIDTACTGYGKRWHGANTYCTGVNAVHCCPYPFADGDTDGDVDQVDFAAWQLCYRGSGGGVPDGCECWDHDGSGSVDNYDYTLFNDCWTGPNVPFDPDNPGSCTP